MKPTIGRILHFRKAGGEPQAAIITKVWSDDCVNLCVFSNGGVSAETSVKLVAGSEVPEGSFAYWPPKV